MFHNVLKQSNRSARYGCPMIVECVSLLFKYLFFFFFFFFLYYELYIQEKININITDGHSKVTGERISLRIQVCHVFRVLFLQYS